VSRRILVTGGAGFIGSHLVEALLERGDEVRVLDDLSAGRLENLSACCTDVEVLVGDVRDRAVVGRAMRGMDGAFHQAAVASVVRAIEEPEETSAVNALGTVNVLAAAAREGCGGFVLASSCAVYGEPLAADLPLREDGPLRPGSPYAAAKLASEHFCNAFSAVHGLATVCLRYFNVYGPRQDHGSPYSGVISRFVAAIGAGEPCTVCGDGLQTRDFIYVGDVVAMNLLAMDAALAGGPSHGADQPRLRAAQVLNVGTGAETSVQDIITALGDVTGAPPEVTMEPSRPADVRRSVADVQTARDRFGFRAEVRFTDGVARTWQAWE